MKIIFGGDMQVYEKNYDQLLSKPDIDGFLTAYNSL